MVRARHVHAVTILVLCALLLPPAVQPADAAVTSVERTEAGRINRDRTSRGLRALTLDYTLSRIARDHSKRMAAQRRLFHNTRLASQVSGERYLGENVGYGPTPYLVHRAFMRSAPHRANILGRWWRKVGVGAYSSGGYVYITHVFYG